MKKKTSLILAGVAALVVVVPGGALLHGYYGAGPLAAEKNFIVPDGAKLSDVAVKLQASGAVYSARAFRFHVRLMGSSEAHIKAGEFLLPKGASESKIFAILTGKEALRRFVTVPEGLPSIMVQERLMAQSALTGPVTVPDEGSILPDTYDVKAGETRVQVVTRMQAGMTKLLKDAWDKRDPSIPVKTPKEALTLASIVEKETGKPTERAMVAGLYENRLRQDMPLQADPTIIYPITRGKPLGRRILHSEIVAQNDYNTYSMKGLPKGPITNPGRASIEAVLHPAKTQALYMVADGTGGHAFADTLEQHNENVKKWFAIRRAKGEI